MGEGDSWPFQSDLRWQLHGQSIGRRVADEAVRAVELLFRMSPSPRGAPHLAAYRGARSSHDLEPIERSPFGVAGFWTGLGPPAPFGLVGNRSGLPKRLRNGGAKLCSNSPAAPCVIVSRLSS
jgi:hypothetical protein